MISIWMECIRGTSRVALFYIVLHEKVAWNILHIRYKTHRVIWKKGLESQTGQSTVVCLRAGLPSKAHKLKNGAKGL